jgi:hypothetical protein
VADNKHIDIEDGDPPVGGTWPRLYAVVIIILVLVIIGSWLFSRAFS